MRAPETTRTHGASQQRPLPLFLMISTARSRSRSPHAPPLNHITYPTDYKKPKGAGRHDPAGPGAAARDDPTRARHAARRRRQHRQGAPHPVDDEQANRDQQGHHLWHRRVLARRHPAHRVRAREAALERRRGGENTVVVGGERRTFFFSPAPRRRLVDDFRAASAAHAQRSTRSRWSRLCHTRTSLLSPVSLNPLFFLLQSV